MADWYRMLPGGEMEGGSSMPTSYPSRLNVAGGGISAGDADIAGGYRPAPVAQPSSSPMFNWGSPAPMAPAKQANVLISGGGAPAFRGPAVPDYFAGRLRNLLDNPGSINSDPAYRFLYDQGLQALSRSAGAKRMRFAGKTMQDFQDYGQGAASQYLAQIANLLQSGAQTEAQQYNFRLAEAQRNAQLASEEAARADPYGQARRVASQFKNADEYARQFATAYDPDGRIRRNAVDLYERGRRLLQMTGG